MGFHILGRVTRGLMLLSGVFVVADLLPYSTRSVLVWNPFFMASNGSGSVFTAPILSILLTATIL